MELDIWFLAAWIIERHGADAPGIAEEIANGCGASDFETWLAIRDAAKE